MKEGNQSLELNKVVGRNTLNFASPTLPYLSRKHQHHYINKHYVNTKQKNRIIQEQHQLSQTLTLKQQILNPTRQNYKIPSPNNLILVYVIILANLLVLLSSNNKLEVLANSKLAFDDSEYKRSNLYERQYYDSVVDVVGSESNSDNLNNEQQEIRNQNQARARARAEQLPDSVYKMAPFLFGADIIPDYFTQPADRVAQSVTSKPSSGLSKTVKSTQQQATGTNNASPPSREIHSEMVSSMKAAPMRTIKPRSVPPLMPPSLPSTQSSQPSSPSQSQVQQQQPMMMMMAIPEEGANQTRVNGNDSNPSEAVLKEQATKPNPNMDHVLSSLELVVEAMKQQTMAMQMISGQMAAKSPEKQTEPPPVIPTSIKDKDARAILESFGEAMGGLRNARQISSIKSLMSPLLDSFGEPIIMPIKGGALNRPETNGQGVFVDQPQDVAFDAPTKGGPSHITTSSTTTSTTPATTTTTQKQTTTSTPKPTTTTPAPSSTTITTLTTTSSASTTTTSKPVELTTTNTLINPFQSIYKSQPTLSGIPAPDMKGWRRVLPFDYYSMAQQDQPDDMKQQTGYMTRSVSLGYPSVGSTMMQPQQQQQQIMTVPDNYRSVSMPSSYSGGHSAMMKSNGPVSSIQQAIMDSEHQRMMLMAALMQHPQMLTTMTQQQMSGGKHMQMEQPQMMQMVADAMATVAQQHQQPVAAMQANMMVAGITPSPMSTGRPAQTMQSMMHMAQQEMSISDEIPKPPGLQSGEVQALSGGGGVGVGREMMFGIPHMSKTSTGTKSSLKIGDRPQFDPSNFQLLIAADVNQQKKAQMMKLAQQMSAASQQQQQQKQQQQQSQESNNQNDQLQEDGPNSSNDLNGGASEKNVMKLSELKSPGKHATMNSGPEIPPLDMSTSTKNNGFSILGGRFKITPHTQMLHWVLDPTKILIQQALGTWAASGTGGGNSYQEGVPMSHKRIPRRNPVSGQRPISSPSSSKVRKNTAKQSSLSHSNQASSASSQTSSSSSTSTQSARNQVRGAKGAGKSTRSN